MKIRFLLILFFCFVSSGIYSQNFFVDNHMIVKGDLIFYFSPTSIESIKGYTDKGICVVSTESEEERLIELKEFLKLDLRSIIDRSLSIDQMIEKYGSPNFVIIDCRHNFNHLNQLSAIFSQKLKNVVIEFSVNQIDQIRKFLNDFTLNKEVKCSYTFSEFMLSHSAPLFGDIQKLLNHLYQEKESILRHRNNCVQLFFR